MQYEFDELFDVAFVELYHKALLLEDKEEIDMNGLCVGEIAEACKRLAGEFVILFNTKCAFNDSPDYWEILEDFIDERLRKLWPKPKKYTVKINVEMEFPATAKNPETAKKMAESFASSTNFLKNLMSDRPYVTKVGEPVEEEE